MAGQRELHDHYFREAKREGYRARAAYKLIEIDDRRDVIATGDKVLDLGAAPGSWLQVASRRVGDRGCVVGIDLQDIDAGLPSHVRMITGDVNDAHALPEAPFDVVLSDMAPSTTGNRTIDHHRSVRLCNTALDLCRTILRPSGNLVIKVFEGESYRDLLDQCSQCFESAKGFKPKASRNASTEMYIVCHRRFESLAPPPPTAPPPPASGW